jgi:hypothetical protein
MKIPSQRSQHLIGSSDLMSRFYVVSENASSRDFGLIADWSHSKDVIFGLKDDRQPGSSKVCPERKLAVAVFSQAANDLQKFRYARRGAGYSLYADARKWIASNDRLWPYSFLNLCDALHLPADVIRAELLGNTSRHSSRNTPMTWFRLLNALHNIPSTQESLRQVSEALKKYLNWWSASLQGAAAFEEG